MKTQQQIVGQRGEEEACLWLAGEGHRIIRRNWRAGHLELDIITLCGKELHIIEVKTRSGDAPVSPEVNINKEKRRRMVAAANAFLASAERKTLPADLEVYFDVLTVVFEELEPRIEYYPQAFIPMFY